MKQNRGKQLWEMPTHSDFAWACFVLNNMNDKWVQDWKYHPDNSDTSKTDKDMFSKYKDLSKEDVEDDEEHVKSCG